MITIRKSAVVLGVALSVGLGWTPLAHAVILNSGFETGDFTDWVTIGPTSVVTSTVGSGPASGLYQALLGTDGANVASTPALETFLGLSSGTLDAVVAGSALEGSAIKQTFSAIQGQTLSFQWNFLTDEQTPSFFNDFAFVSVGSVSLLADTNYSLFSPSSTFFAEETGFNVYHFPITSTGAYQLGLGVLDVGDDLGASGLLLDDVQLVQSQGSGPVPALPEPGSLILMVLGAGFLGIDRRRRMGLR